MLLLFFYHPLSNVRESSSHEMQHSISQFRQRWGWGPLLQGRNTEVQRRRDLLQVARVGWSLFPPRLLP